MTKTNQRGFIAITTTMILMVILLVVATSLSFSGFFTRYNILDSELKKVSVALAEGCVDQALLELANDSSYSPSNQIVSIGGNFCTIKNITTSGGEKNINVEADYQHYITNLSVKVNPTSLVVTSWQEVPSS